MQGNRKVAGLVALLGLLWVGALLRAGVQAGEGVQVHLPSVSRAADGASPTATATHPPSHTATATPTHPPSHTATATPTATGPVTGTVLIENGFCCVGGTAGQQLDIDVAFTASSPAGQVTEMRVHHAYGGGCANATTMAQQPWQPFSTHQAYTITVAINWIGFYTTAQYRDLHGTLSPLVCDDISVEGMPPPPLNRLEG